MKKIIYLLILFTSISYSQNTTIHFYYGSSQELGSEIMFHIRGTESTYLGGGFSGALNQNKALGDVAYGHINSTDVNKVKSLDEEWCSIYAVGSLGFLKTILIKYRGGLAVYNKKDTFDKDGYLYNKIDKVVYKPLVGVSAMYALSNDYGVELGVDTFNKVTVGFTVLF